MLAENYGDPKAFMEYSNNMNDIHSNINNYNPNRNHKYLFQP